MKRAKTRGAKWKARRQVDGMEDGFARVATAARNLTFHLFDLQLAFARLGVQMQKGRGPG
jgi:hypothetical protein